MNLSEQLATQWSQTCRTEVRPDDPRVKAAVALRLPASARTEEQARFVSAYRALQQAAAEARRIEAACTVGGQTNWARYTKLEEGWLEYSVARFKRLYPDLAEYVDPSLGLILSMLVPSPEGGYPAWGGRVFNPVTAAI